MRMTLRLRSIFIVQDISNVAMDCLGGGESDIARAGKREEGTLT
jgi:hypothetical protein